MSHVAIDPLENRSDSTDEDQKCSVKPELNESSSQGLILALDGDQTSKPKEKVWIEAYGCSASMNDSEIISGLLRNDGYEISETSHDASINIIVTCSVKDVTEHRMLHRIAKLSETGNPLVVAGCLPKADRLKVESVNPTASLIGPDTIEKITEVVRSASSGRKQVELEKNESYQKVNIPKIRLNSAVSIVQIASGCMSECSFCQTKLVKGDLTSYRPGEIIRQIQADVNQGCKEIWLSSTDNGCYGRDIGTDLANLLLRCCGVEGDFKIRVGMMNPMYIPQLLHSLLDIFYQNNKLFKFLHIPVQSGSDRILGKMKRGHSAQTFLKAVRLFRDKIPEITIATDVIVGYPSETEDDFRQTIDLLRAAQPEIVNLSKYSARPGVLAATEKKVHSHITKNRTRHLDKILREISCARNSPWVGWTGDIIIDEIAENYVQGRNYAYKPIIVAASNTNKVRGDVISLGSKVNVKVIDFSRYALRGNLI